jgi:hypothetical protein
VNIPDEQVNESVIIEFAEDFDPTNREHEVFLAGMVAGAQWARKEALREAAAAVAENRLEDNANDPEDIGYMSALNDALDTIRALVEGEGQ